MVDARNLTKELRFHGRYGSETQQECAERKNTERERAADRLETLERQIAELRASGHDSFKLACMWQDQANAAEADKARLSEALQRAEQAFEEIRLILIYNLHDSERYAFWKAVSARDAVRAALSGSGAGGWRMPDGWRLVPVEPTLGQQNAGWREVDKQGFATEDTEVAPIYRAMIAAAPTGEAS